MIKVRILDRCEFCDGEDVDANGCTFDLFRTCEMCQGSGNRAKWVGLRDLSDLLERAIAMEPDYLELAREKPVSQYQDTRDAALRQEHAFCAAGREIDLGGDAVRPIEHQRGYLLMHHGQVGKKI